MSSEQIIQFYGMAEGGVVEDVKTEVGDDTFISDKSSQQFTLLLRVTQTNGRPLQVGGFTGKTMSQIYVRSLV